MRPSRDDLHVLASATRRPRELARLVAGAVVEGHDLEMEVRRDGRHYVVILRIVRDERIVAESVLPVAWTEIDEATRFGVLAIYVTQMLHGHERWHRAMNRKLAILRVISEPSPTRG